MPVKTLFDNIEIRFATSDIYISASLQKIDYELDLAIIKVENPGAKPTKTRTGKPCEGEKVYAIGNARNYGISIIEGMVSQAEIVVTADGKTMTAIQCDLNITEGSSGGALFDAQGRLVGITTFRLKDKLGNVIYGMSFAIPVSIVIEFLL